MFDIARSGDMGTDLTLVVTKYEREAILGMRESLMLTVLTNSMTND